MGVYSIYSVLPILPGEAEDKCAVPGQLALWLELLIPDQEDMRSIPDWDTTWNAN